MFGPYFEGMKCFKWNTNKYYNIHYFNHYNFNMNIVYVMMYNVLLTQ